MGCEETAEDCSQSVIMLSCVAVSCANGASKPMTTTLNGRVHDESRYVWLMLPMHTVHHGTKHLGGLPSTSWDAPPALPIVSFLGARLARNSVRTNGAPTISLAGHCDEELPLPVVLGRRLAICLQLLPSARSEHGLVLYRCRRWSSAGPGPHREPWKSRTTNSKMGLTLMYSPLRGCAD